MRNLVLLLQGRTAQLPDQGRSQHCLQSQEDPQASQEAVRGSGQQRLAQVRTVHLRATAPAADFRLFLETQVGPREAEVRIFVGRVSRRDCFGIYPRQKDKTGIRLILDSKSV